MAKVTVRAITLEKVDLNAGNQKFYRAFTWVQNGIKESLFQYGSQRTGRSGGQYRRDPKDSLGTITLNKKRREGYVDATDVEFTIDSDKLVDVLGKGDAAAGGLLANLHVASCRAQGINPDASKGDPFANKPDPRVKKTPAARGTTIAPNSTVVQVDRLEDIANQALDALTLAAEDPIAAAIRRAELLDELEELNAGVSKIKSYIDTLGLLVQDGMTK